MLNWAWRSAQSRRQVRLISGLAIIAGLIVVAQSVYGKADLRPADSPILTPTPSVSPIDTPTPSGALWSMYLPYVVRASIIKIYLPIVLVSN